MADDKFKLDVPTFLEANGIKLKDRITGGLARVETSEGTTEMDINGFMQEQLKAQGVDTNNVEFEYSSKEKPLESNPLSFSQQMGFAVAKTAKDKQNLLTKQFGEDNVNFNEDTGTFAVKDSSGDWKTADASFLPDIVATEGATMAAGIVGAEAGAALGTALLPGIGTVLGGALGGTIGAVVGKFTTLKDAEDKGIRTDLDAQEVGNVLGQEVIYGLGYGLGVPIAVKGLNAAAKGFSKLATKVTSPESRKMVANLLSRTTGQHVDDVTKALENVDDFSNTLKQVDQYETRKLIGASGKMRTFTDERQVIKAMQVGDIDEQAGKAAIEQLNKIATPAKKVQIPVAGGADPIATNMRNKVIDELSVAQRRKGALFAAIETDPRFKPATRSARVNLSGHIDEFEQFLRGQGLLDEAGNFVKPSMGGDIAGADRRALKEVWEEIQKNAPRRASSYKQIRSVTNYLTGEKVPIMQQVTTPVTETSFDNAIKLRRQVDKIIDAHRGFDKGLHQMSEPPLKALRKFAVSVGNDAIEAVPNEGVRKALRGRNALYSTMQEQIDTVGDALFKGSEVAPARFNRLFGNSTESAQFKQAFEGLMSSAKNPIKARQSMRFLENQAAFGRMTDVFRPGTTISPTGLDKVISFATAGTANSPRTAPRLANWGLRRLQAAGKTSEFIGKMTEQQKRIFLQNPQLIESVVRAYDEAVNAGDQMEMMTQQAIQQAVGGGG